MQINKIQNNSTNFRALKINSKLRPEVEKLDINQIRALKQLGEEVKSVRLYDICFENNLTTPTIRNTKLANQKDYLKEFREEEKTLGERYFLECENATYQGIHPNEPKLFKRLFGILAKSKYALFKEVNEFKQIATLTKMLEKDELNQQAKIKKAMIDDVKKHSKEDAKALERQHAADDLMENHQYEANKPKNMWSRFFN